MDGGAEAVARNAPQISRGRSPRRRIRPVVRSRSWGVGMVKRLPFPLTCAGEALRTKLGWAGIIAGAAFAVAVWHLVPAYLAKYEHVGTTITSAQVVIVDPSQPAYALAVRAEVFVSPNCRRITHFALADAARRLVFPLGQIASGAGFSAPWRGQYSVVLQIPPSISAGDYSLSVRAIYDCSWLGVFRSQIAQQADMVPVRVPG